jgi:hypothetical protein
MSRNLRLAQVVAKGGARLPPWPPRTRTAGELEPKDRGAAGRFQALIDNEENDVERHHRDSECDE